MRIQSLDPLIPFTLLLISLQSPSGCLLSLRNFQRCTEATCDRFTTYEERMKNFQLGWTHMEFVRSRWRSTLNHPTLDHCPAESCRKRILRGEDFTDVGLPDRKKFLRWHTEDLCQYIEDHIIPNNDAKHQHDRRFSIDSGQVCKMMGLQEWLSLLWEEASWVMMAHFLGTPVPLLEDI